MTYHRVYNKSNTTVTTCGAGNAYPFGAPEYTPGFFCWVRVAHLFLFFVVLLCVFTVWVPCCDVCFGFDSSFSWVHVARSLIFCVVFLIIFCPFVLFIKAIVLSVLQFRSSDSSFVILELSFTLINLYFV